MKKAGRFIGRIWQLVVLLVIFSGALLYALFQGNTVSWAIFYAQLPFTLFALLVYFYPLSLITVERHVESRRLQYGEDLQVKVVARKKIPFPHFYFVLYDQWFAKASNKAIYEAKKLVIFSFKREMTWQYTIEQLPRGEYEALKIHIDVADMMNWAERTKAMDQYTNVIVFPQTVPLTDEWMRFASETGSHMNPLHAIEDVLSVASIRAYEHGDRLSWVHWKSFAKTDELMTKEFEQQEAVQGLLLFDPRTIDSLETRITFTASIIARAKQEKMDLRFCHLADPSRLYTMRSSEEVEEIFTSLAKTTGSSQNRLSVEPIMRARRRDEALMIVTASIDWSFIETLARTNVRNHFLLFLVLEREEMLEAIQSDIARAQQKGVHIYPVIGERIMGIEKEVKV